MATWRPAKRLTSVDLPTFGRPTTATTASSRAPPAGSSARLECPAQRGAVGRDDLDVVAEVLDRRPVYEPALRQADVRQEVAAAGGLSSERPGEIGSGDETGDGDVAAEEVVLDGRTRTSSKPALSSNGRRTSSP